MAFFAFNLRKRGRQGILDLLHHINKLPFDVIMLQELGTARSKWKFFTS